MGVTKVRYGTVRVADKTDDQKTPVEILNALASSVTQEDLQEFLLSQLKRVIHGSDVGTWKDDFESAKILSLRELTQSQGLSGFEFNANCLPTDTVGDIVYFSGDSVGGILQVTRVDILDPSKVPGIGVILSKNSPVECMILRYGILNVSGLIPGKTYFTGLDGRPTLQRPTPVSGMAFVQVLGVAMDSTRFLLNPSFNLTRVRA